MLIKASHLLTERNSKGAGDVQEWLDAQKFDAICQQLVFPNLSGAARSLKDISHIL